MEDDTAPPWRLAQYLYQEMSNRCEGPINGEGLVTIRLADDGPHAGMNLDDILEEFIELLEEERDIGNLEPNEVRRDHRQAAEDWVKAVKEAGQDFDLVIKI